MSYNNYDTTPNNINNTEFDNIPYYPPAASNADDEDINDSGGPTLKKQMFMDLDQAWSEQNNERQFYTTVNRAVPPPTVEFSKWLYSGNKEGTCKENTSQCLRQTELRRGNGQLNPY